MKRMMKILVCCLLVLSLLCSIASATDERAATLLTHYNASISENSSGALEIEVVAVANTSVMSLGASSATLEAKINGSWEFVCSYNMTADPDLYSSNTSVHRGFVYYDTPEAGTEYRVQVSFFAHTSDIRETRTYTSGSYIA